MSSDFIIPAIIALTAVYGCASAVWIASAIALTVGIGAAKLFARIWKR